MTVLELFCCSGGLAEGLRRAGITVDVAFDADPNACESYGANLGHRPVQMDVRDLLRLVRGGWGPRSADLLVADPPCTPYSRAGKRLGPKDARDMLGPTVELIAELKPHAYLIANVPGLDDSTHWHVIQDALKPLARMGYCVADYFVLNAADYGVPQIRVRPFWFGHLAGPCLGLPEPTHADPKLLRSGTLPGMRQLAPWVTCKQALGHLPPHLLGRPVGVRWKADTDHNLSDPNEPARTQTQNANGDGSLLRHPRHPINTPDAPSFTITARDVGGAQGAFAMEWPWDRPSTTVTADERISPPGHHDGSFLSAKPQDWTWNVPSTTVDAGETLAPHGRNGRAGESQRHHPNAVVLSEQARAILQGFPEGWKFAGDSKKARNAQIGMAMPPPLGEAVGRSIAAWQRKWRAA